jgi:hypothetical protein
MMDMLMIDVCVQSGLTRAWFVSQEPITHS